MLGAIVLALWCVSGLGWWLTAWWLVRKEGDPPLLSPSLLSSRSLSIFKPLPPLSTRGLTDFAPGLESFVAQLDPTSELLLGVHEADRATVAPFLDLMGTRYPKAQVRSFFRAKPDTVTNPKIATLRELAPHAIGELWLWSDSDIVAPPGFLAAAREEFARAGVGMVTFPYVGRRALGRGTLFEALFVNVEFYPGVLLLRRFGAVDFGFGAGMLFARDVFERKVIWPELGAFIADDFQLGQRLGPVRIGTARLESVAPARTWLSALYHDLRWARTIRWSRPGGSFARILVLPVAGWLLAVALHPGNVFAWAGLAGMIQADVLAATAITRAVGGEIRRGDWLKLECWSVWRVVVWFLSWLPGPVTWSGRTWRGPRAEMAKSS